MKVRSSINGLTVGGKERSKGDRFDVDDDEGKGLISRGLVCEIKGRKPPVVEDKPEGNKGGGK